jgi:hypothetical protein
MIMKKYIKIITTVIAFVQIGILFADWEISITAQDTDDTGADHTITLGTSENCIDGWKYGEDQYDYPNPPSIEYTNIHFFHLDWFGQADTNGNICEEIAFSTDYRAIHPSSDLISWGIRGLTGNDLSQDIPINLSWDAASLEDLSNSYELFLYVGENGHNMRQLNNITINQQELYLNGNNPNIKILMGACAATGPIIHYFDSDGDGWGSNQTGEYCPGFAPPEWVENNLDLDDELFCNSNEVDCEGVLCGLTIIDGCDICGGNNSTCADCAGVPNGYSMMDSCGFCDNNPDNDCVPDCSGEWGGSLVVDECDLCGGDNSSCSDCAGIPNGDAVIDECGECSGLGPMEGYNCDGIPQLFVHNASTLQAFYFFISVTIDDEAIDSVDWIGAFKGNICVGAKRWDTANCAGGTCDVPVLGDDQTEYTEGYMASGDIPTFKVFDASENSYFNAIPSEEIAWSNFGFNVIDSLSGIGAINYCLDLHQGANLKSFYALPSDLLIANVMFGLGENATGVITEGGACSQISPTNWVGSQCSLQSEKGYWIMIQSNTNLCMIDAYTLDPTIEYNLHTGANLISFPYEGSVTISGALPNDVENSISGVITEGGACNQISPGLWVGSQCSFVGKKGYWLISIENTSFSFDIAE